MRLMKEKEFQNHCLYLEVSVSTNVKVFIDLVNILTLLF